MTKEEQQKMIEELTKENEELKQKLTTCARCGFDLNKEHTQLDESVLRDYYKYLVLQTPFEKDYELLDGAVVLTFVEPDRRLLALYRNGWRYLQHDSDYYASDLITLLTLKSVRIKKDEGIDTIISWSYDDKVNFFSSLTYDNVEKIIPKNYQDVSNVLLTAIRKVAVMFNELCFKAADSVQDENFWKGAGLN